MSLKPIYTLLKARFESIIFYLHYWFFINLRMTSEWAYAFLNAVVIIFCLMYSLIIPHSNQNKTHHFFLWQEQYPSFQNPDFGVISLHLNHSIIVIGKQIWRFFSCGFTIVTADVITYYAVCFSFQDPQDKFIWASQVY